VTPPRVTAFPAPRLASLLKRRGSFTAEAAGYAGVYASGRSALYWAFRALQLPTASTVWMPSFHCGLEVQAAIDAGLNVDFYRIGRDLAVDVDDLAAKLRDRPGPVLAIHYFGFAQPEIESLVELCRRAGVTLIED
jgi:dTDP-4-amino-4,6-dideoxygalactose transaminase